MDKKTLSESDICDKFIRPAIESAGWDSLLQIHCEYPLRAGRVVVRRKKARRDTTTVLRADYALCCKANIPLVVVEAKDNQGHIGSLPIVFPVPQTMEQRRIVARVTELRRLCADLSQRLAAAQATRSRLADALVVSALA